MQIEVFASSLGLAVVLLVALGWKWCMGMRTVVPGALVVGVLTWAIVDTVDSLLFDLGVPGVVLLELFLIPMIPFPVIMIRFFRDPERTPSETENVILSPADGRVVYVKDVEKGSSLVSTKGQRQFKLGEIMATDHLSNARYLIGIDMNILNVHVNRAPIAGRIVMQKHINGSFLSLRREESEVLNERVSAVIDNGEFKVGVIQIASRLVRRIVSYLEEGDTVTIGQRIGMIKFGSQVDVAIPELDSLRVMVKPGDEVRAGVTVVARYG